MSDRNIQIERLQSKRDTVTDEVFRDFCARINIKDIRYIFSKYIFDIRKNKSEI